MDRRLLKMATQLLGSAEMNQLINQAHSSCAAPTRGSIPVRDRAVRVTRCGRICIGRRKINLSTVFAGQMVGIREVDNQIWLVSFMDYDLGFFDTEEGRVEPAPNPFAPGKVLTISPV